MLNPANHSKRDTGTRDWSPRRRSTSTQTPEGHQRSTPWCCSFVPATTVTDHDLRRNHHRAGTEPDTNHNHHATQERRRPIQTTSHPSTTSHLGRFLTVVDRTTGLHQSRRSHGPRRSKTDPARRAGGFIRSSGFPIRDAVPARIRRYQSSRSRTGFMGASLSVPPQL
jgi:hypothetical protein